MNERPDYLKPVPDTDSTPVPEIDGATALAAQAHEDQGTPGLTPPLGRAHSGMFITDVLVTLGFIDKERAALAVEEAHGVGRTPESHPDRAEGHRHDSGLEGGSRAVRALSRRSERVQGRHGRREPDHARRGAPLQRRSRRLHARRDRASCDVGSIRRHRRRRHPDDHGRRLPGRGCAARRHRGSDPAPQHPGLCRLRSGRGGGRRKESTR